MSILATSPIICVSGGFDPLHGGHLAMFREAATHGKLVVILNSDEWLTRKKNFHMMAWDERAELLRELKCVHDVVAVDDADGTVCEALARLRPHYFANGGDRTPGNTPEIELCLQLGIQMLWNIGGEKDSHHPSPRRN